MSDLYKHYTKSIAWNTFESVCYQLLLLGHQCALFYCASREIYGLIGVIFSITYFLVMITNFGLDVSIGAFFTQSIHSKAHFKKIILTQLIPEYCLIALIGIGAFLFPLLITPDQYPLGLDIATLSIIGFLIILEGGKKTIRSILQLGFYSSKTACIEVLAILTYIAIVWTGYYMGYPIGAQLALVPLLVTSSLSTIALLFFLFNYYQKLPHSSSIALPTKAVHWRILKNRFFNFLNQLSHSLFSSNFLVPFFAGAFGLSHAGILKLTASIAHCFTSIIQKTFGISGAVLLAHLKESTIEQNQKAFYLISHRLNQALYSFIIFFAINYNVIITLKALPETPTIFTLGYLFMVIIFSESFFIAYEKFYITHEKANHLFLFNLITMGSIAALLTQTHILSHLHLMLAIIALRIVLFITITLFSLHRWRIKPSLRMQPSYVIPSLITSLAFFIYMKQ